MSLSLYYLPNENSSYTDTNVFTMTFDGRYGGYFYKQLFIRNDDVTRWYDNITIQPVPDTSYIDGTNGFEWKLISRNTTPVLEEWEDIVAGSTLELDETLGSSTYADIVSYIPIWVYVKLPRGLRIQKITDIVLRISAQEHLVTG